MKSVDDTTIITSRLILTALRREDADEMVDVLDDDRLHEFVGGHRARRDELRNRYGRLAVGSPNPDEVWLNWIVRHRSGDQAPPEKPGPGLDDSSPGRPRRRRSAQPGVVTVTMSAR